ncbi:MAG: 50S ribosomal protein L28 [Deltaproteobacteria bacterium]|nr:50S ribosomal protein L28 [Deltaproteobacteria bacterium]MBI3077768.1 50S ribosomal protein L28 [Deltaproteobacteria bacterium]
MARICEICGKRPAVVANISHAHNRTKRVVSPNLRRVKALIQGTVRTVRVCTRCIRSGHVTKAG